MYADEFGVLRHAETKEEISQIKHSPIVKNSEVSISNVLINKQLNQDPSGNLGLNRLNDYSARLDDFSSMPIAHSFYVSRHYTILPKTASVYNGIGKSFNLNNPESFNIRIVDSSGNKYVDEFNNERYEIFIERYPTSEEDAANDFYKVIALIDDPDPVGLYLVYDKFERNESNIPYNQFLNYKEYINSMPVYSYVVEESEVIDPSSYDRNVYSTQLFAHKENKLLKNSINDEGWKVVTPKKAIQDPRTFQNFNWRLLAKINYNFSKINDIYQSTERAIFKAAVLYSGLIENMHNPYVFANLEESVINQQNFLFENPLSPAGSNKSQRSYWAVNIDTFNSTYATSPGINAYDYDMILWTPSSTITDSQKRVIDSFLANGVSVFLDCSLLNQTSLTASGLANFDYSLNITSKTTGYISIDETYQEGDDTFNGWDLNIYQENDTSTVRSHNVFGPRVNRLNNDAVVPVRVFNGNPESADGSAKSIVSIQDGSNSFTAILRDKYTASSEFSSFIIISLNPFLTYVNDNYGVNGISIAGTNNGASNSYPVGVPGNQKVLLSEAVIGPNKLFYNILTDSNRNRVNHRTKFSENSTVIWNISPWRNSWTINGKRDSEGKVTVLFEDEKLNYDFKEKSQEQQSSNATTQQTTFCREIHPSIGNLLQADFELTSVAQDANSIINTDYSNVELYLECTNNNVEFLNFEKLDSNNFTFADSKTTYNIFKLSETAKKKLASSSITLDAYTKTLSKEFDTQSIFYPYIILDYSDYENQTNSVIKTPKEYLPGSQFVKDYDFDFKTQVYVTQTQTNRSTFTVSWFTQFTTGLEATVDNLTYMTKRGIQKSEGSDTFEAFVQESNENGLVVTSASPFKGYKYPTNVYSVTDIQAERKTNRNTQSNNFHYTFDVPISGRWAAYEQ